MNKRPKDILCFGNDWYSPSKVSIRQIVEHFHAGGSRVLWVNPVPIRFPDTRQKDFWNKVRNKARTHARFLSNLGDGLYVYSPLYVPFYKGPGFWINRIAVSAQVLLLRLLLGMWRPLVFGSTFTAWFGMPGFAGSPLVFHFADKISSFREVSDQPKRRRVLERMEKALIRRAVLATCSSRSIFEHVLEAAGGDKDKVKYLPHAVKASVFLSDTLDDDPPAFPAEMRELNGPVAGYFGSLTETNDKATFQAAAEALPGWNFVFIGKAHGDYTGLQAMPNVHFLGPKPHADLPAYGAAFDVCFMGWKAHEWIANCFPLKTLEYLALGKPIVCSGRIDELVERFGDFVTITGTPAEFVRALTEQHALDTHEMRDARREAVRQETWDHRIEEIVEALQEQDATYAD